MSEAHFGPNSLPECRIGVHGQCGGGGVSVCQRRWWCLFDPEKLPFASMGNPHFMYTIFVSISKSGSFSCDLGCVLAIVSPTLYCNVLGDKFKRLLPQFAEHCVCIGVSVPNLLCVCVACLSQVSQPGGVCKAEWCPIVCVCASKSDGPSSIEADWCSTLMLYTATPLNNVKIVL